VQLIVAHKGSISNYPNKKEERMLAMVILRWTKLLHRKLVV